MLIASSIVSGSVVPIVSGNSIANPPAKHATIPMITMGYGLGISPMRIAQMPPILATKDRRLHIKPRMFSKKMYVDMGTCGHGDMWTWGHVGMGTCGHGDMWTWGHVDMGTWKHGDMWTWGHVEMGTCGNGDMWTWGHGDMWTWGHGDMLK